MQGPLLQAVREFTTTILNPYDLAELLHRMMGHACAVTGSQGAGVMLRGHDGLKFAAASDDDVVVLEQLQDRIEDGACYEAFATDRLIAVDDLDADSRWPAYRERALERGFRSVLAVPMHACGHAIGVLNIYRERRGGWSDEDVEAGEILAAMGAGYVLHATEMRAQHELAEQLQTAIESRDTIGQAKGILMARHQVDADTAFGMLRRLSQERNVKLRDLAASIVEHDVAADDRGR